MVVMRGLLIDKPQVKRLKQLDENPITRLIEVV